MTVVISSLCGGEAARVIVTMANHWAGSGCEVMIVDVGLLRKLTFRRAARVVAHPLGYFSRGVRRRGSLIPNPLPVRWSRSGMPAYAWTWDPIVLSRMARRSFRGDLSSRTVRAVIALRGHSKCALRGDGVRRSGSESRLCEWSTRW